MKYFVNDEVRAGCQKLWHTTLISKEWRSEEWEVIGGYTSSPEYARNPVSRSEQTQVGILVYRLYRYTIKRAFLPVFILKLSEIPVNRYNIKLSEIPVNRYKKIRNTGKPLQQQKTIRNTGKPLQKKTFRNTGKLLQQQKNPKYR